MAKNFLLGLVVCLCMFAATNVRAQCPDGSTQSGDYCYTESGGDVTIVGYTGSGGDVVIPDTINGMPVTRIGGGAFYKKSSLISVVIPDSVTDIMDGWLVGWNTFNGSFSGCTNLSSVTVGNSVTSIGYQAFFQCSSLTSVTIPASVTFISETAYGFCSSLSTALFLGDAPALGLVIFLYSASDFKVCYTADAAGFTSPEWEGYPAEICECMDDSDCDGAERCDELVNLCVECLADEDCDDAVMCNGAESCSDGMCVAGIAPCADGEYCDELVNLCVECLADEDCDDAVMCDGAESCSDGMCVAGIATCADGEYCNEATDTCEEIGTWTYEQIDPNCSFIAMWAASETDMYIGGSDSVKYRSCVYHFDGIGWEPVSLPGLGVFDIWGSSGDDVYVVGVSGWYHYDGSDWTQGGTTFTRSVWGFSWDDVFISAKGIGRYQGTTWDAMLLPADFDVGDVYRLWGSSSADMYAVSSGSTVLHYDGNQDDQWEWLTEGLEGTSYYLFSIWASSPDDIFASGDNLILHYDGNQWSQEDIPYIPAIGIDKFIYKIYGTASDDVYAIVYSGHILHYDGIEWSLINPVSESVSQMMVLDSGLSAPAADLPDTLLRTMHVVSADSIYFAGDNGIVIHYTPDVAGCVMDSDCSAGDECVEGVCEAIFDAPPAIDAGLFLAGGSWTVLPTSSESPMVLTQNENVLWTFSDDYAACSEDCTHVAEYQAVGAAGWAALSVTSDDAQGYALVALPIDSLQNATTYAFRFSVTDCANQSAQSQTYYFRVATEDDPPAIAAGPFLAAGAWTVLPTTSESPMVLTQNENVLWTFSDDYAACSEDCMHIAKYQKAGDSEWIDLTVTSDSAEGFALVSLPIEQLKNATYAFQFSVTDCAAQTTSSEIYYFEVDRPDQPPEFLSEPRWVGAWTVMSADASAPDKPQSENVVFYAYDDDGQTCQEGNHSETLWMYRSVELQQGEVVPLGDWSTEVPSRSFLYWVLIEEPTVAGTAGPGLFEFKIILTDCIGQTTNSEDFFGKRYYFQVD